MYKAELETLCMNIVDLKILMAFLDEEKFFGFSQEKKIEQEDIILGLHNLVKKEIIDLKDNTIIIREKYREVVECMRNPYCVLILEPTDKKYKKKCCYVGEKVLVSEISNVRKNEMLVYYIEKEQLSDLLLEEEYFFVVNRKREDFFKDASEEKIDAENPGEYFDSLEVCMKIYLHKKGKCMETVYLTEEGLNEYIYTYAEAEKVITRQIYSKENIAKRLWHMML